MITQPAAHDFAVLPVPRDLADVARWDHGRRRRRMLSGRWAPDLEGRVLDHFGAARRPVMGPKSLAKNSFRKLCHGLGANYDETPKGSHAGGELGAMFGRDGLLTQVGLWPTMRRAQVLLVGMREVFLWIEWSADLQRVIVQVVTPDVVTATAHESAPTIPVEVKRLRWRSIGGRSLWCWDWVSILDSGAPFLRVVEAVSDDREPADYTAQVLGRTFEGDDYPFRWTEGPDRGRPFLPCTLYHAMRSETLFDPFEGIEVVEGSLDVAAAYTFLQHCIFKASWPQRWALGAYVMGAVAKQTKGGPRTEVPTDPTSLLHLEAAPGVANPQVGQWGSGIDPVQLATAVAILERGVSDFDGLDCSHLVHDTANPWSAGALAITREEKRQAQARYGPELHPADLETIAKIAAVANIQQGAGLPESGYLLEYRALPLSRDEAEERRASNAALIDQGRLSIVGAYQNEHPGLTRDEAIAELEAIAADNARFGVGKAPTPATAGAA